MRGREIGTMKLPLSWVAPVLAGALLLSGCGMQRGLSQGSPVPADYAALPETVVCVVDRSSERGLRDIPARSGAGGSIVLLVDGRVQPLEAVHPINVIAGYAGSEPWLTRGDPIPHQGRTFVRYLGERRIDSELLQRVGEHQGILLFAEAGTAPPARALYVPTAPGCIFQGYAREDLMNQQ